MRRTFLALCLLGCSSSGDDSSATAADSATTIDETSAVDDSSSSETATIFDSDGTDSSTATDVAPEAPAGRDFSSDKTKFFGASRCATAKVQLCEDFESGTLDKTIWTVNGTAPTIEGTQHARGSKALHIKRDGNGSSFIREKKTFPAPKNTYWGRIFVRFEQLPTPPGMTYAHWTFAAASGTGVSGEIRLSGQLQSGKNKFGVGTDNRTDPMGTGDWTTSDNDPAGMAKAVPTGEWLCIEWQHDGEHNETHFYWDAIEHTSMATTETKHGGNMNPYILPTFDNVWVGWSEYQASTETFEMWVDEIAIDPERIGCVL
ncbi:MAG: hypothetical protein ACXWP4_04270 [Polyangiales bacterium]